MTREDPLGLDAEEMRRLGYRTVDMLVERFADPGREPAIRSASRKEMVGRLHEPPPAGPAPFDRLLEQVRDDVMAFASRCDHPGYFAFIPGSGTWPGVLGDFVTAAYNVYAGSWQESAGPSQVELTVLDWFRQWIGYPDTADGVLVSGGSAANMTALGCAREALLGAMSDRVVAYVADQAHSSMARAARVLGFRPDQVRVLPVDDRFRMRPDALEHAMDADVRASRQPLFVSASAGATNTGSIDPLPEVAAVCRDRGVWFHVDGAYGGFAALSERGKEWLRGIELADSVTLDPHKWLYQPFECGALLVRDGRVLREAFEITPDYLKDTEVRRGEVNFADRGVQLTRMTRALKVWLSLKFFGMDAFRDAIDRCIDLAEVAQREIEENDDLELMSPRSLGIVCFRRRVKGAEDEDVVARVNEALMRSLNATGRSFISSTRLRGRYALRLCVLNHTSTERDVRRVLDWVANTPIEPGWLGAPSLGAAPERSPGPEAPATGERHAVVGEGWLSRPAVDGALLADVPLFRHLSREELERVARWARRRKAPDGEAIVRQWDSSREFFVLLEGTVEVHTEQRHVADVGPGGFFGELAALDWGATFGYPRLATVQATSPVDLLVIPGARLNELMREIPVLNDRIRDVVRERLPGL